MRKQAEAEAALYGQVPYEKADADKWWPDYHGHQVVTIDECHGGYFQWHQLLKTIEEGQLVVQFKQGQTPFVARTVYMTCNDHPATWYEKHSQWDDTNAFRARIKEFGQLWVFRSPSRVEQFVDGQLQLSSLIYHPPVRDLELAQPLAKAVTDRFGLNEDIPDLHLKSQRANSLGDQLAATLERMITDALMKNHSMVHKKKK